MDNNRLAEQLIGILKLKKEPVGIKVWKEEPRSIMKYQGNAFPGLCTQIGEILAGAETFHTGPEHCFCTGGVVATGVAPPVPDEQKLELIEVHNSISKSYKNVETALCYENEMAKRIPVVSEKNTAVQIGRLRDITQPDLILLFSTPGAADIINRCYCYVMGEPIQGFGGNGGCPFLIQYPYVTNKPSFSYSDVAWRKYVGLSEDELTISFPYQCMQQVIDELPFIAEAYRRYGEPGDV